MNYSQIYQVLELNLILKNLVNREFIEPIQVMGEISNYKYYPSSGHTYFSLKDEKAQINCVFFKNYRMNSLNKKFNSSDTFIEHTHTLQELKNGVLALVKASLSVYEKTGQAQLVVYEIEPVGEGLLQKEFDAIRLRLEKQGYFDAEHKKPLPKFPSSIGIIASSESDALKDVLTVLKRRYPIADVYIYPSSTQGAQATKELIQAISLANEHHKCDVLILTRGGGSIEDLWAFNDEKLAHSIFNSQIPIISAIGHQNNYTISDYVADFRAPTPSAAAEIVSQNIIEMIEKITTSEQKISRSYTQKIQLQMQQFDYAFEKINDRMNRKLNQKSQDLKEHFFLIQKISYLLSEKNHHLTELNQKISSLSPIQKIKQAKEKMYRFQGLLNWTHLQKKLKENQTLITHYSKSIDQVSNELRSRKIHSLQILIQAINSSFPLAKGFAVISHNERIVKSISDFEVDQSLKILFKDGMAIAKVLKKE